MNIELELNGLNCTSCADKIESMSRDLDGVKSSTLNFVTKKLKVDLEEDGDYLATRDSIKDIVLKLEPDVEIIEISRDTSKRGKPILELELNGLNCTNCAEKIESIAGSMDGVESAELNFITKKLKMSLKDPDYYDRSKDEIEQTILKLEPDVEVLEISKKGSFMDDSFIELELNGLTCTNCAEKIESMSAKLDGVKSSELNFVTKKLQVSLDDNSRNKEVKKEIISIVNELEPDVEIIDLSKSETKIKTLNLELEDLNCASCAEKIEMFTKSIKGVESARLDFLARKMIVEVRSDVSSLDVKDEIVDIVETLEPGVKVIDLGSLELGKKKKEKKSILERVDRGDLFKIGISAILFAIPWLLKLEGRSRFLVYFASYIIIGHKVIIQAFRNVKAGVPFDENFLMTIATAAAFFIGEYPEAVMVMLLYQIGETMQGIAVNHSRDSITALMDIRPDYANLIRKGEIIVVDPSEIRIGDQIVIRPGERVALDGVIIDGSSSLDTSNITGESVPRSVEKGDEVLSGVVNLEGVLTLEVTKEFGESTISQILDLVENASSQKAETENFITRFSRYYTPVVVFIALGIAILPPILTNGDFNDWLYRASVFLVISCPCALVISVPLGFFGGLGGASKAGVLVKGGNYLEALTEVDTIVFDKTGTVTEGVFEVTEIKPREGYSEEELLEIAAYGESFSNHPIGRSIVASYDKEIDSNIIDNYRELAGKGIKVDIDSKEVLLGNKALLDDHGIEFEEVESIGTIVYIAIDSSYAGRIIVSDRIKDNAAEDLARLHKSGIKKTVMLSGDNEKTVHDVAEILNIDEAHGNLLPQDKVDIFEGIISNQEEGSKVAFVGDGVNDAPVLARADVGIAMGGLGSDAAIEASDIVIMTDDIGKISTGINIAKNTKKIVLQNIVLALGVKLIVLILGAFGEASMWQAVFADVGVSIIAIINSMRALKVKE